MARIFVGLGLLVVVDSLGWRLLSKRESIPCPTWLGWLVEVDHLFCKVQRAEHVVQNAGIVEGMVVLDAGCGPGRVAIPAALEAGKSGKLVAMDIQQGMLGKTLEKERAFHVANLELLCGELGEGKLQDSRFE